MQVTNKISSPFSKTNQHDQKYKTIISAASELFNIQGSRATTLKEIAEKLQLTKTSLYYYVKTKEELIYQCYQNSCIEIQGMIDEASSIDDTPIEKIVKLLELYFDCWCKIIDGKRGHLAGLTEVASLKPKHRDEIYSNYRSFVLQIKSIITEGIESKIIKDIDAGKASNAICGTIIWLPIWLPEIKISDRQNKLTEWIDILKYGIKNDKEQTYQFPELDFEFVKNAPSGFDREFQSRKKREAFYHVGSIYFNQKGFKATSLDEIAQTLGVTKGAFYYHINNKEELLIKCFQRSIDIENRVLDQALALSSSGIDKLAFASRQMFNIQLGEAGPLIRYSNLWSLELGKRSELEKEVSKIRKILGQIITMGIRDKSLKNVDCFVAENLIATAIESIPDMAAGYENIDISKDSIAYFQIFFNGISKT